MPREATRERRLLVPTTITPRCPTSHTDSSSILEPGNPRSGRGSGAGAFPPSHLFFCFVLFLLGFGRPPTSTTHAGDVERAEDDEKTRETPASSLEDPDFEFRQSGFDQRQRPHNSPTTSERADDFQGSIASRLASVSSCARSRSPSHPEFDSSRSLSLSIHVFPALDPLDSFSLPLSI
ncbi:hypothetical protein GGF50DRAFT_121727 [Schizophyllum commune]